MIQNYLNKHKGEVIVVAGCGPSIDQCYSPGLITIGVNDIERTVMADYLVCIDSKNSFPPHRWQYIEETNAWAVFSHLDLPIKNKSALCKVDFAPRNTYHLEDPNRINKSYLSPYVAVNIAYWMGASEIYMIGVDLVNHPLKARLKQINNDFKQLHKSLQHKGVQLYNASSISKIDTIPFKPL
jgi:hypothetical protein